MVAKRGGCRGNPLSVLRKSRGRRRGGPRSAEMSADAITWGWNKVGHGVRCALVVGVAVVAMAAESGARADVRPINLDGCSGSCVPVAIGEQTIAEDDAAASITLSRFGGDADDPNSALIFDRKAIPAALADGLPLALASASAEAPGARGVSPYDFFADVIDVPHSADARAFTAVSFFLFTPSLTSQLSDVLSASNDFFGPPSGDIASHRGIPLSVDAAALTDALTGALYGGRTMRTPVTPTLSPSPLSGPPSSDASEPFGQVGNEAGRSSSNK